MSKQVVRGGDVAGLLERFARLREKTRARTGKVFPFVVIQEAGLYGSGSIAPCRMKGSKATSSIRPRLRHHVGTGGRRRQDRRRGAGSRPAGVQAGRTSGVRNGQGTDFRGRGPSPPLPRAQGADRRAGPARQSRQGAAVLTGDIWLRAAAPRPAGAAGYAPARRSSRLPDHLKAQVRRELDRLELLLEQIKAVEAERDVLLAAQRVAAPAAMLLDIKGIGPGFAAILWSEGLFRHFDNRRQVASYAGLATTPWQSGSIDREQGVSKALGKRGRCFRRGPMRGSAVRGPDPPGSGVVQFGVNLHKQNKTNAAKTPSTFLGATLAVTRVSIERGLLRLFRKSLEWGQCELLNTTLLGNSQYGPCLPMGSSLLGHAPPPSRLC